jgi:hypothetical protein
MPPSQSTPRGYNRRRVTAIAAGSTGAVLLAAAIAIASCHRPTAASTANSTTPISAVPSTVATTPSRLSSTPIPPPPPISVVPGTRYAFPAHYDKGDPIQERPADLRLNVRFYQLNNLTWIAWGTDGADGSGTEFTQTDCDPSCVEGTHYRVPVRIHAFNPQPLQPDSGCPANVAGVLFYSEVILTYLPTTAVSAPKDQESGEGFQRITVDGLPAVHYWNQVPHCDPLLPHATATGKP